MRQAVNNPPPFLLLLLPEYSQILKSLVVLTDSSLTVLSEVSNFFFFHLIWSRESTVDSLCSDVCNTLSPLFLKEVCCWGLVTLISLEKHRLPQTEICLHYLFECSFWCGACHRKRRFGWWNTANPPREQYRNFWKDLFFLLLWSVNSSHWLTWLI